MGHSHHHHHPHPGQGFQRAFLWGTALNVIFVVVEAGFGFWTQSLALLADAGHNLSDVLGLLLAWGASYLTQKVPSDRFTYGWRRSSIVAALLNGSLLFLAMGGIGWEALQRLHTPAPVPGVTLMIVASIGVVINTGTALLFFSGRHQDLNIKGAFLHMMGDALVSVGVVLGGLAIVLTDRPWFDPVISLAIVVIIVYSTWSLFREALELLMDGVPAHVDLPAVRLWLQEVSHAEEVHDLHVWAMSTTETALTAHLVRPQWEDRDRLLRELQTQLQHKFQINHSTIQIEEAPGCGCSLRGNRGHHHHHPEAETPG